MISEVLKDITHPAIGTEDERERFVEPAILAVAMQHGQAEVVKLVRVILK